MKYRLEGADVLILSIVVLFAGIAITRRVPFLQKNSIPEAVTGGLLCSCIIGGIYAIADVEVVVDMRLRDVLLLVFFSTIGLSARFAQLLEGGRALVVCVDVAAVFLVVQDATGVLLASLLGVHPGYGLFGGSISLAGGYGTAIAWGEVAQEAGLVGAQELGIAFATFGLIAGGMIGGPLAERLIKRHGLEPDDGGEPSVPEDSAAEPGATRPGPTSLRAALTTILLLAICVELGDQVNRLLFSQGVTLPGFLTAMFVGIVITNVGELIGRPVDQVSVDRCAEFSLPLFLSMSLMSIQLWTLATAALGILLVLGVQILVITGFTVFVLFRALGRTYDAAVMAAGFAGLGLGATPVGIANMGAVTDKYGPSRKAFLVIPLVGAFFIDLVNALVIKFFIGLPLLQQAGVP